MAEIVNGILQSHTLRRPIPYNVVVPYSYRVTRGGHPVLYLLHGLFGNCSNWIELTGLSGYADLHNLIIVTTEGADSWYVDSATNRDDKFESYFLNDLIPEVDTLFRTHDARGSRGIAGNSMGGYGALKFAFRRPDLFSFAASSSGAFHAPLLSDTVRGEGSEELLLSIKRAFGKPGSTVRRANDLARIVSEFDRDRYKLPAVFLDCGKEDGFLDRNREFSRTLAEHGIPHTYREYAGGHDWTYWNHRIKTILRVADEMLR